MSQEERFFLTKQGVQKIISELEEIKEKRKLTLGKEPPTVLSSEELNAEFVSFREDLDYFDSKIVELENVLKHYQIIKPPPKKQQEVVGIGASVLVEVNGKKNQFLLVGTLEANPSLGRISNESPVGRALLNRKAGDKVVIETPARIVYKIKKVSYQQQV